MNHFKEVLFCASAIALSGAMAAHAQEEESARTLGTVTVTGSFIAGTPEDAALPVDVVSAADLRIEGNPSLTELVRNLGVSSGIDGETNQFASNGLEGTSNINLRGLGAARTLVLINGRRQTYSPYSIGEQAQLFVDTNMLPSAAIGRIEVLKDGAAALYGSDAIAGVVNFITRTDLEGFEVGGSYSTFDGSDGDYTVTAAYGLQMPNANWITSAGFSFRSEVPLLEKDWAILPRAANPVGGWSAISNPGRFVPLGITGTPLAANVNDNGCEAVGGVLAPTCNYQFTQFDNLVEEETRFQIFSEYNRTFGNGVKFHVEGLYANTDVPDWKTSPSYPPQVLTSQFVPANNPGFAAYLAANPGEFPAGTIGALFIGRSFAMGGYPGTGGAQTGFRKYEGYRFATDLSGDFDNGINWDIGVAYSQVVGDRSTNDTYIAGFGAALRGFGICTDPITGNDPATGTLPWAPGYTGTLAAGAGTCQWHNPFSNGIVRNAVTGEANPNYIAGLENSVALGEWMTDPSFTKATTSLLVFDAVTSGISGIELAGGNVGWAAGAQIRTETFKVEPSALTDLAVTPGPGGTGPYAFLAGTNAADRDQTIYAVFAEAGVPLAENIDIQLAARYEDYGGGTGSTFDPKIAGKWQIAEFFALRGSAQTSFRGPTLNQTQGVGTTLQFVAPASAFKAVDQFGNANLKPESATSFNIGALVNSGTGFTASLDYYNFDFSDPIIVEEQSSIVAAAVAALAAGNTTSPILSRITFQDPANPTAAGIARIRTNIVNGPSIKTSGLDFRATQVFEDVFANSILSIGADGTYVIEYVVDDFQIEGVTIAGGDRVGQFNRGNFSRSLPQWKANAFVNLEMGDHNFRGVVRHITDYVDERAPASRGGVGAEIDSQTTFDLFYTWRAPWDLDIGLSVVNVTDEDPPFAAFDLNYDPYTHNPFGRTFKFSIKKKFG
ncbi:MAG: TonB-dependent receptor domain-containing protein [Hyphomonas sp.]